MNEPNESAHKFTGKTRVYLADDHEIFRTGLRTILRYAGDVEISGESATASDLVDRLESARPNVLLLGSRPDLTETINSIKQRLPSLKILVLGSVVDFSSDSIGILDGYINKDSSSEFLRSAIRTVVLGGTVWHHELLKWRGTKTVINHTLQLSLTNIVLSLREKRLLMCLTEGKTNKQISMELNLAQVTVKKALQTLFVKVGATNRTQAVMKASHHGLI